MLLRSHTFCVFIARHCICYVPAELIYRKRQKKNNLVYKAIMAVMHVNTAIRGSSVCSEIIYISYEELFFFCVYLTVYF